VRGDEERKSRGTFGVKRKGKKKGEGECSSTRLNAYDIQMKSSQRKKEAGGSEWEGKDPIRDDKGKGKRQREGRRGRFWKQRS